MIILVTTISVSIFKITLIALRSDSSSLSGCVWLSLKVEIIKGMNWLAQLVKKTGNRQSSQIEGNQNQRVLCLAEKKNSRENQTGPHLTLSKRSLGLHT